MDKIPTPATIVAEQAEDEGLWFVPVTASEDYLQQALRRLHAAVEAQAKSTPATHSIVSDSLPGTRRLNGTQ